LKLSNLLGVMTNIWVSMINVNSVMNSAWVLWLGLSGTIGVFIIKHSMYFGTLSIWRSSFII
jgi:hypothetical protein